VATTDTGDLEWGYPAYVRCCSRRDLRHVVLFGESGARGCNRPLGIGARGLCPWVVLCCRSLQAGSDSGLMLPRGARGRVKQRQDADVMDVVGRDAVERSQNGPILFGGICGRKASLPEEVWSRSRGSTLSKAWSFWKTANLRDFADD